MINHGIEVAPAIRDEKLKYRWAKFFYDQWRHLFFTSTDIARNYLIGDAKLGVILKNSKNINDK